MVYEGLIMVSGLVSGLVSGVGSLIGSSEGRKQAQQAQLEQIQGQANLNAQSAMLNYVYNKKLGQYNATQMPSFTRQGLESAGYNPMLAVSNGMSSGSNSSFTSNGSASAPDYAGNISAGIANAQSLQRLKNESDVAESTSDQNYANADKAKAEKATLVNKLPYVSKQAKADYMKTEMESAKLENDIHYQNEYLNYLDNSLKLQEKLGQMGIDVKKYGIDMSYNASTFASRMANEASHYASNVSERNNKRSNRSSQGFIKGPFGMGVHLNWHGQHNWYYE